MVLMGRAARRQGVKGFGDNTSQKRFAHPSTGKGLFPLPLPLPAYLSVIDRRAAESTPRERFAQSSLELGEPGRSGALDFQVLTRAVVLAHDPGRVLLVPDNVSPHPRKLLRHADGLFSGFGGEMGHLRAWSSDDMGRLSE